MLSDPSFVHSRSIVSWKWPEDGNRRDGHCRDTHVTERQECIVVSIVGIVSEVLLTCNCLV